MSGVPAEHQPSFRLVPRRDKTPPQDTDLLTFLAEQEHEPAPAKPARKPTIDERFAEFDAAHPEVYAEFVRLARLARSRGRDRIGLKMIAELVRWHFIIDTDYDVETNPALRLNNVLVSRYARKILQQEPDLAGIFELRQLKSA